MSLFNLVVSAGKAFSEWRRRRQAYDQLMGLDDHSLADLGIRRSEIRALCEGDYGAARPVVVDHPQRQKQFARKAA